MKKYFLKNKIIFTSVFILIVFSFANSISAVFFNPISTPPNSNISSPINVGPDFQTKTGLIAVNGLRVLGPTILDQSFKLTQGASNGYVLTSDADGNASWQSASGGGSGGNGWSNTTGLVYLTDVLDNVSLGNASVISLSGNRFIHTTGTDNTFLGPTAGATNITGGQNTGVGTSALRNITSGNHNTAFGYSALNDNTTGSYNTSIGYASLFKNLDGSRNTAFGTSAIFEAVSANDNTAIGGGALLYGIGSGNTAVGAAALTLDTGSTASNNTAIGFNAEVTSTGGLTNSIAIGTDALSGQNNTIKIGSATSPTTTTSIDLQVAYTPPSDLRLKENINDIDLGLEFIKKLRPVSYTLKGGKGIDYGFIAQEVETAIGKDTNLVLTDNTEFRGKTMRYTELIAPLAKAIQEQQEEIEGYRARLEILKERARILEEDLNN